MIKVISRASIVLKEISIDYLPDNKDTKADEYARDIGRFPYIVVGGLVIQTDDTVLITLYNDQFLPKIQVQFRDPTYKMIDPLFPLDDDIISLFIRSSSEVLMPVRMDFKITDTNVVKSKENDSGDFVFVINGILDVNYLYYTKFITYKGTSFDVIQKIASESKLGFASNLESTNDSMTWINPGDTYLDYLQKIVAASYKSDEAFMYAYVDFYYNLNYVDIETALNEDISGQIGMSNDATFYQNGKEGKVPILLTDKPDQMGTNMFINKFNLLNSTTRVNIDIGYKTFVSYYDKNKNTYYKLIMDTISTPGAGGDQVILKGKVGEISELAENSFDFRPVGRFDSDNVHPNYPYAIEHNMKNLDYLQKVKIVITLGIVNFNLFRFQKIDVKFYKLKEINSDKDAKEVTQDTATKYATNPTDTDAQRLNQRLSGEWLITAINYNFNKISVFSQDVTLVRRELGFNSDKDFK